MTPFAAITLLGKLALHLRYASYAITQFQPSTKHAKQTNRKRQRKTSGRQRPRRQGSSSSWRMSTTRSWMRCPTLRLPYSGDDINISNVSIIYINTFIIDIISINIISNDTTTRGDALTAANACRKSDFAHHHLPEGVVHRSCCLNSSTFAVSEIVSRRWWCIESLLPESWCRYSGVQGCGVWGCGFDNYILLTLKNWRFGDFTPKADMGEGL